MSYAPVGSELHEKQLQGLPSGTGEFGGAVLRAQATILSRQGLSESATALAVELARTLFCTRVSVGIKDGHLVKIQGTSEVRDMDERLDAAAIVRAAMHEALDQSLAICFPSPEHRYPAISIAHAALVRAVGGHVCTVVIVGTQVPVGAITLERDSPAFSTAEIGLCEDIASFSGPVLEIKQQLELALWRRLWVDFHGSVVKSGRTGMAIAIAAGMALILLTLVPVGYRVSAPARLEGSVQRVIVAAADGFLQQANVRAGDSVTEGQVLAELATQDLLLERHRRESELKQHENAYQAAQANKDRAQMVISQSRAGEAQAMLSLAEGHIERARIQAPFDGIVIKGDLNQTLGSPVQRGEVLLTIAPNNSFRLIVEVDESDIASIRPGQTGELALAAVPDRALKFKTRRVIPFAASSDSRNYFEVEAVLDEQTGSLRPGLSGIARINVDKRTLWWIATHRLQNWARLSLWSWGW